MALDFPSSPTDGQVYDNWIYSTAKGAWEAKPLESAKTITADVAPANPEDGDQWFNTNDGTLYIYVVDVDGGQWVESQAPITANGYYSPNYLINGAFDIWQRGTSIALNNATGFTADRWCLQTGNNTTTSRQASGLTGFRYSARVQRNSGATSTSAISFGQPLETSTSIPLAGKTVTLSWYAKAGANYSASGSIFSMALAIGTGTDQNRLTTGYTGDNVVINNNYTLTTSWQRFSATAVLPDNTNEIMINPYFVPTGTAGANDWVEITGVQLEEGAVATTFRRNANSIQGELAACQRYFESIGTSGNSAKIGWGNIFGTTSGVVTVRTTQTMRAAPSFSITGSMSGFRIHVPGISITSITNLTMDNSSVNGATLAASGGSGATAGQACVLQSDSSGTGIWLSAEL